MGQTDCKVIVLRIPKEAITQPSVTDELRRTSCGAGTLHGKVKGYIRTLQQWRTICRARLKGYEDERFLTGIAFNNGHLKVLDDVIPFLAELAHEIEQLEREAKK